MPTHSMVPIKKRFLRDIAILSVLISAGLAGMPVVGCATGDAGLTGAGAGVKLKTSNVCMMNNKFMGTEQIPVPVNGKNYYGCCAGCAASLQNNPQIRQATDPYSGEEVDKADAFIVLKSLATKEVLYFKSEGNFKRYSETLNSKNMSKV